MVVERAHLGVFRQGREQGNERQQRYRRRSLRRLRPVEAELDCGATVIVALFFVMGWRLLAFRMLATREKLEARQDLQPAVETRRHPEDRYRICKDCSPSQHLTQ